MKIPAQRIESFLKAPDAAVRAILIYGPDQGLVRERVLRLAKTVVPDLKDPFRVAEFPGQRLAEDPALLSDEASAISMTGGRRVVMVRSAADAAAGPIERFLNAPSGDALILIEGGDLAARSELRKLFEGHAIGAALPCYADDGASLDAVIQQTLRGHGLTADPDAVAYLSASLGSDRGLTRAELDKLALYMGGPGKVSLQDAVACIGDNSGLSLDDIALAAADGDHRSAQNDLDRLFAEGSQPITVLRSVARHFVRLHLAKGMIENGSSPDQALAALRPPVFFKAADRFRRQLSRWPLSRLTTALDLLLEAEQECKTTGYPAQEITSRALMRIAQAAGKNR